MLFFFNQHGSRWKRPPSLTNLGLPGPCTASLSEADLEEGGLLQVVMAWVVSVEGDAHWSLSFHRALYTDPEQAISLFLWAIVGAIQNCI